MDVGQKCLGQADVIHRFVDKWKDTFEFVTTAQGDPKLISNSITQSKQSNGIIIKSVVKSPK